MYYTLSPHLLNKLFEDFIPLPSFFPFNYPPPSFSNRSINIIYLIFLIYINIYFVIYIYIYIYVF